MIFESYPEVGFNYRMTDLQAAIGRVQLQRLPAIVARAARSSRQRYDAAAGRHPGVHAAGRAGLGAQQLAELLRPAAGGCDQRAVMQHMLDDVSRPAAA